MTDAYRVKIDSEKLRQRFIETERPNSPLRTAHLRDSLLARPAAPHWGRAVIRPDERDCASRLLAELLGGAVCGSVRPPSGRDRLSVEIFPAPVGCSRIGVPASRSVRAAIRG